MNESPNPYRPPVDIAKTRIVADLNWHDLPHHRLDFSFQLTPADVHRFVTPRQNLWFPLVLAVVTALLVVVMLRRPAATGVALQPSLLLLVGLLWAVISLLLFSQRLIGKQSIAQSPVLLESTTGYINPRGMFVSTHHARGFIKWESIRRIALNEHCVALSSDNWRQIGIILPWSGFEDPSAARAAIESVSQQITVDTSLALDERLRLPPDDESMFPLPERHVSFSGDVKIGAITNVTAGKKLRRSVRRVLIIGGIGILLASTTLFIAGLLFFTLVGLPICIVAAWLMIRVYKHPLYSADPDTIAFRLEGWFGDRAYFVHTFNSQTLRQYAELQACSLDDSMIALRIPGSIDAWQFIPRSMFSSDEDFRQVSHWLQTAVSVVRQAVDRSDNDGISLDQPGDQMPD